MKLSTRGVVMRERKVFEVRELTKEDLPTLREPRVAVSAPKRFRDPHHRLAKLLAFGLRLNDAAAKAGYSYTRAHTLSIDPSFRELVARYAKQMTDSFAESIDDYTELATSNMLKAERMLAEKLDEADENAETLPVRELIAISRDAADRFGYGKKQTNVNVNVDFASQLERAIQRSGKIIDSGARPASQHRGESQVLASSPETPLLLRRA